MFEQRPAGDAKVGFGNRAAEARGAARGGDHEPDAPGHCQRVFWACIEAGAAGSPSGALWVASTTW